LCGNAPKKVGRFIEMSVSQENSEFPQFVEAELFGKGIIRLFQQVEPSFLKALL
jgi:hypothetical protein